MMNQGQWKCCFGVARWLAFSVLAIGIGSGQLHAPKLAGKAQEKPADNVNVFDSREQNLVNGLRDRGLYSIAESHCVGLLKRDGLTATDQASLAIERIRNQAAAILAAGAPAPSWPKVDRIADAFEKSQASNPRAVLVGLQQALAHLSFANMVERELAAKSASQQRRNEGIVELRKVRSILDKNRRKATEILKRSANGGRPPGSLTSEQLRTLITSFDYQLAIANLTTAKLLTAQTEMERLDRVDSLDRVLKQLAAVRSSVANSKPLWWQTWINEASCRRMMGDLKTAAKLLRTMQSKKRPNSTDEILLQEEIELAITTQEPSRLQSVAKKATTTNVSAETEIAILRLWVAGGQIEKASVLARKIALRSEPYWTRRADLALLSGNASVDRTPVASDAETRLLLQAARKADESGNLDAALKGYQSVAESQFSSGQRAEGLATTALAGKVLEKQNKHAQAAEVYLRPASAYPKESAAASIHLRGCWNLSKAKSDSFSDALEFHIDNWPQSTTANQARLWLGSVLSSRKKYSEAMAVLLETSSESSHFPAAIKLARSASRRQLTIAVSNKLPTKQLAKRLLGDWETAFKKCNETSKPLLAAAMAEIGLAWGAEPNIKSHARLEELSSLPSARSNPEFLCWLGVASGSISEIEAVSKLTFNESSLRQLLRSLNRIDADETLATIKLKIIDGAMASIESGKLKTELSLTRALALAESGRRDTAIKELKQLITANPKNLAAKLALARVLPAEAALKQWRLIARQTRPQSDAWFESKYNVARLLVETGQRSEAVKMLEYMKAIPPGWKESELSNKFDSLLKKNQQ